MTTILGILTIGLLSVIGNYILTVKENKIRGEKMSDLHDEISVWREHLAAERMANEQHITQRR